LERFTLSEEIITLESRVPTTLTFVWNTASFAVNRYTIIDYAGLDHRESDLGVNTFVFSCVFVTGPGDVRSGSPGIADGSVDMRDIGATVAKISTSAVAGIFLISLPMV